MVGDINADSLMRNLHCCQKQNATFLENLIERYKLIVNKNTNFATRLSSQIISIIYLTLTNSNLSPLCSWKILEKYLSLSNRNGMRKH